MKRLMILMVLLTLFGCQKDNTVTIGYQLMANPWKYLIATDQLKELDGKKVEFKKFTTGAKVINAMASGDVDIAISGSTSIAAGLSQGLDVKLIWVMEIIGEAEALVVKNDINSIADLKGKKVGVPYGSTTHFHLMLALKNAGMSSKDLEVLNLTPPSIVASWKKGDIAGAFVWSPALEDIKKTGKVLMTSKDLADAGSPTFDGIIASGKFLKENKKFASAFLDKINTLHAGYNSKPWDSNSVEVQKIASFVGSNAQNVSQTLKGYVFPLKADQNFSALSKIIKTTAEFLKSQGKIDTVLESYEATVARDL
jgi:taurine transport system substrate-binding protein